jgi:hypothetical protein
MKVRFIVAKLILTCALFHGVCFAQAPVPIEDANINLSASFDFCAQMAHHKITVLKAST